MRMPLVSTSLPHCSKNIKIALLEAARLGSFKGIQLVQTSRSCTYSLWMTFSSLGMGQRDIWKS